MSFTLSAVSSAAEALPTLVELKGMAPTESRMPPSRALLRWLGLLEWGRCDCRQVCCLLFLLDCAAAELTLR